MKKHCFFSYKRCSIIETGKFMKIIENISPITISMFQKKIIERSIKIFWNHFLESKFLQFFHIKSQKKL